ncbi:MAG: hypothetical protein IJY70_03105 [Clostridia bacterium]|nr:hypothetical protein [Clostridia bacterium]
MKIYYLYNESQKKELNGLGYDYSPAYFKPLFALMGVSAQPISNEQLGRVGKNDILVVGAESVESLPKCKRILLGTKIGEKCVPSERKEQIFAYYELKNGQKAPLFVPVTKQQTLGKAVAYANANGQKVTALVKDNDTYEFCFDLLASVWFSGDGYLPTAQSDYFSLHRTPDFRPNKSEMTSDAFNDFLIEEVEDILRGFGVAMLYKLPQKEGKIPDMLIHFSGDDDCTGKDINLQSAYNFNKYGFPYHINAMANRGEYFIFDKAVYDEINSLGCEIALHTDFTAVPYEYNSLKSQAELFEKTFGERPYTNTNHCLIQDGSTAERMRWFAQCGIRADNGKLGCFDPSNINAFDLYSYGYGTAFPRFTCDDANHGNELIDSIEIPITYYEPRLYDEDSDKSKIRACIDDAQKYGRIIQFFIHPHYVSTYYKDNINATIRVLDFIKEYTAQKEVLFTTTNNITRFWFDRRDCLLKMDNKSITVDAKTDIVVVLPPDFVGKTLAVDGVETPVTTKTQNGKNLSLVCVSKGLHTISRK